MHLPGIERMAPTARRPRQRRRIMRQSMATACWHGDCVFTEPATIPVTMECRMRSIKGDLEQKRSALQSAIHSNRAREIEFREVLKDPYGSASLTHDDEMTAAVMDRRARELKEVTQALEDMEAGRYG